MKMDKLDLLKYLYKYKAEHKNLPTYYEIELIKEEEDRFPYTIGYFTSREEAEEFFEAERFNERDGKRYSLCFLKYKGDLLIASERKQVQCGSKIILPIKPKYAEKILDGKKWFEYRRKLPNRQVSKIVIYETTPVKKLVGEVNVIKVIKDSPYNLYEITKDHSGISLEDYIEYFNGANMAYAYVLSKPTRFPEPIGIEQYGLNGVPQSYVYLGE